MDEPIVKKLIARYGERTLINSSPEEMHRFIVDGYRPDFEADEYILCIKFLQSDSESMEYAEESSWFINPNYAKKFNRILALEITELEDDTTCLSYIDAEDGMLGAEDVDNEVAMEFASIYGYSPKESYGPKMAAEFLPEILVLQESNPNIYMLEEYQSFYAELLTLNLTGISYEEKLNLFSKYFKCKSYTRRKNILIDYLASGH